jgi:hypothetical protein
MGAVGLDSTLLSFACSLGGSGIVTNCPRGKVPPERPITDTLVSFWI